MFKTIISAIVFGAGTTLGSILVTKCSNAMENPVNRAKIKKTFENIKKKLRFKGEYRYYQEAKES